MSYYFQHDYDAMSDDRLLQVRAKFGIPGYGVFWMCLETMAKNENGHIMATLLGGLSIGYGISENGWLESFLDYCVEIQLFKKDKKLGYFSPRMLAYKNWRNSFVISGKKGGDKRWANREANTPPIGTLIPRTEQSRIEQKKTEQNRTPESEGIVVANAPTPKEVAIEFFSNTSHQEACIALLSSKGVSEPVAREEVLKFISYWTELNSTGKKMRWEKEKTFEVKRRLVTWMGKVQHEHKSSFHTNKPIVL